ncbi:hypothetical protein ElyMa_004530300 [Elysia marginata]|uniref:Uncharacterized protein n=1 Tax=Elysia marginata TaxID=1093978 RepID=A0AAV4HMU2_9GAST|nr:hypothetical protein ElyMa_004530300 [Elysia marginata]
MRYGPLKRGRYPQRRKSKMADGLAGPVSQPFAVRATLPMGAITPYVIIVSAQDLYGDRAFTFQGPDVWNRLPLSVQQNDLWERRRETCSLSSPVACRYHQGPSIVLQAVCPLHEPPRAVAGQRGWQLGIETAPPLIPLHYIEILLVSRASGYVGVWAFDGKE